MNSNDSAEFIVTGVLAGIAAVFRAVAQAEQYDGLTVQVRDMDAQARTARLALIVVPKETWFLVEGNIQGLEKGQTVRLQIRESAAHFAGRELRIKQIVFLP